MASGRVGDDSVILRVAQPKQAHFCVIITEEGSLDLNKPAS
jgi:hypothetical protein